MEFVVHYLSYVSPGCNRVYATAVFDYDEYMHQVGAAGELVIALREHGSKHTVFAPGIWTHVETRPRRVPEASR